MNQDTKEQDINLLSGQIIVLWITIIEILFVLIANYNELLRKKGEDGFIDFETEKNIILTSKIVLLGTVSFFLYKTYINYQKRDKKDEIGATSSLIQLTAAILVFIAALLSLYATFRSPDDVDVIFDNPEI